MTGRAAGAAVAPPAPAPTSSTATAIRGWRSGANATNHASVSRGSSPGGGVAGPGVADGLGRTVLRSSAVPVLPATWTPGTAAAIPVPPVTTARMYVAIVRATDRVVARVTTGRAPRSSVGRTR